MPNSQAHLDSTRTASPGCAPTGRAVLVLYSYWPECSVKHCTCTVLVLAGILSQAPAEKCRRRIRTRTRTHPLAVSSNESSLLSLSLSLYNMLLTRGALARARTSLGSCSSRCLAWISSELLTRRLTRSSRRRLWTGSTHCKW